MLSPVLIDVRVTGIHLQIFALLDPCCDVRNDFAVKATFGSSLLPFVHVFLFFVISIYLRILVSNTIPHQMMFLSNMKGVTSGARTANPSRPIESIHVFRKVRVAQTIIFCVVLSTIASPFSFSHLLSVHRITD